MSKLFINQIQLWLDQVRVLKGEKGGVGLLGRGGRVYRGEKN